MTDAQLRYRFRRPGFSRGDTLLSRAGLTGLGRTSASFDREGRLVVFMAAAPVLPAVVASFVTEELLTWAWAACVGDATRCGGAAAIDREGPGAGSEPQPDTLDAGAGPAGA